MMSVKEFINIIKVYVRFLENEQLLNESLEFLFRSTALKIYVNDIGTPLITKDHFRQYMSSLSEKYSCAGWLVDCEYELYRCVNEKRSGQEFNLTSEEIQVLTEYCELFDGWWTYEEFLPIEEWRKKYREWDANNKFVTIDEYDNNSYETLLEALKNAKSTYGVKDND